MRAGPSVADAPVTAGPFVVAKLRALDERLADAATRVLAEGDAEAVHDLRVALRRMRTVLEVGGSVLGRYYADAVRRSLRAVQRATGTLRDEEVLRALLDSVGPHEVAVDTWRGARARRERRLRGHLRGMVRAGDVEEGRRLLAAMLVFPIRQSRDRPLGKFARRAVDDALREVEARRATRIDDVEGLHDLRIAYKRLRYTVEVFADALPAELAALGGAASRFQSRLGDLHDADVAIASAAKARSLDEAGRAALTIALRRVRAKRAAAYEQEVSAASIAPSRERPQAGTDSLRKSSTR